uniref:Vasoactive intestinal peptide receptor 1 n=1 Tax=Cairina moschata TaxID=8855 RepID=A0A8C3BFT7_CAIMO
MSRQKKGKRIKGRRQKGVKLKGDGEKKREKKGAAGGGGRGHRGKRSGAAGTWGGRGAERRGGGAAAGAASSSSSSFSSSSSSSSSFSFCSRPSLDAGLPGERRERSAAPCAHRPEPGRMGCAGLRVVVLSCLLSAVSSTRPECSIILEIEEERNQCLAEIAMDNQTSGCRRQWDNITCWPEAQVGAVVVKPCPKYFRFLTTFVGNVTRNCTSQGWTDVYPAPYTVACGFDSNSTPEEQTSFYGTVKTGYTIGHTLSLIALTAAMIILCLFRKLHCTRNYIHMHLFMSFIMRAIAVFIKDVILFESGESEHCFVSSVGCKAMMVFFQYCVMANFFWLLVEGLYLHTLLVISFFSERKYFWWYILIGWGAPSVFITAWTIVKIYFFNVGCWEEIIESPFWWIIKAPILVSILVNFILFICIIRILVQKLHSPDVGHNETSQYSRLAKSTLLLIPLFGIHYIMFAFFPDNFKTEVKLVFELVVGSFQVQAELKRKWRRWHMERFLDSDMKYHHPSLGSNGTNFSTQISMLTKCSPKTRRCSSFQAEFSLV